MRLCLPVCRSVCRWVWQNVDGDTTAHVFLFPRLKQLMTAGRTDGRTGRRTGRAVHLAVLSGSSSAVRPRDRTFAPSDARSPKTDTAGISSD